MMRTVEMIQGKRTWSVVIQKRGFPDDRKDPILRLAPISKAIRPKARVVKTLMSWRDSFPITLKREGLNSMPTTR